MTDQSRSVIDPRGWSLWRLTTRSLTYVLVVDAIAVTLVVAGPDRPITAGHWGAIAGLLAGMVGHAELVRSRERLRRVGAPETVHVTTDTVWIVAATLLVPWPLVAGLIMATTVHRRLRVARHTPSYRLVFSTAANLIATSLAVEILTIGGVDPVQLPTTATAIPALLAAILARDLAYAALVAAAILLSSTAPRRFPAIFATLTVHAFEIAAASLGALLAAIVIWRPALAPLVLLQLVALDHAAQLPMARDLARIDGKTGLLTPTYWDALAQRELARARRHRQPVGLLMLDIDHFRTINERHGHLGGDIALLAVATTITEHVHTGGIAGRFGGEEFAVLLCDSTPADLSATAATLRARIAELAVPTPRADPDAGPPLTVTVSIGGSHTDHLGSAEPEAMLTDLLLTADAALFQAKAAGRNRFHLAPGSASDDPLPRTKHRSSGDGDRGPDGGATDRADPG
jgi:diguanylate cyclase (GGDEF)-like protein